MHAARARSVCARLQAAAASSPAPSAAAACPSAFSSSSSSSRALSTSPLPSDARKRGALLIWGRLEDNRLGMKLPADMFSAADTLRGPAVDSPLLHTGVGAAAGGSGPVVQVVCRAAKTLALTEDGSVWSWGSCENLSLGHGEAVTRVTAPKKIEALAGIRIVQVRAINQSRRGGGLPSPPHTPPRTRDPLLTLVPPSPSSRRSTPARPPPRP
jgi:hypothetical protein